ncbi:hypothetical protein SAMN04488565_1270 [Leucobacter chromiiresistens]|uniref:Uncharacterized protein n=1 Tax=Leucobacter chromiiresistens TaxID=1079994 RepID=A0A1H0YYA6_9MICO|nr:hypothetical protein SAMN04488565_1270 [Leucobacter chromiiresistens]
MGASLTNWGRAPTTLMIFTQPLYGLSTGGPRYEWRAAAVGDDVSRVEHWTANALEFGVATNTVRYSCDRAIGLASGLLDQQ